MTLASQISYGRTASVVLTMTCAFPFAYLPTIVSAVTFGTIFPLVSSQWIRFFSWVEALILATCRNNRFSSSNFTLDIVLAERAKLCRLISGVSTAAFGVVFSMLSGAGFTRNPVVFVVTTLSCVTCLLTLASMVSTQSLAFNAMLLDVRHEFPFKGEGVRLNMQHFRDDLDSLIGTCASNPVGISVAGIIITPTLVKTLVFSMGSGLASAALVSGLFSYK